MTSTEIIYFDLVAFVNMFPMSSNLIIVLFKYVEVSGTEGECYVDADTLIR